MQTFTVWGLDVWGHGPDEHKKFDCDGDCDGYTVNNRHRIGTIKCTSSTDAYIAAELVREGYIDEVCSENLRIDGDDGWLFIEDKRDGYPLLQLELEE